MSGERKTVGSLVLGFARIKALGSMVGLVFQHLAPLLPIRYVLKNARYVAFRHPVPVRDNHILVIPRHRIASSIAFLSDQTRVDSLVAFAEDLGGKMSGEHFSLSTNMGRRQEVKQVHFHMIPEMDPFQRSPKQPSDSRQLGASYLHEHGPSSGITTIECWLDASTANAFAKECASVAASLRSITELFQGGTVFIFLTRRGPGVAVLPTVRIVLENPASVSVLRSLDS